MNPKTNLNNTQRKMLDEIYTDQFNVKERLIMAKRADGLRVLMTSLTKKERKSKDVKAILDAANKLKGLMDAKHEGIRERGMEIKGFRFEKEVSLELSSGYYNDYRKHPEIVRYEEDTEAIKIDLAQKRKEIRARVYGLSASYEEADKEISNVLKGIKV